MRVSKPSELKTGDRVSFTLSHHSGIDRTFSGTVFRDSERRDALEVMVDNEVCTHFLSFGLNFAENVVNVERIEGSQQ